MMTYHNLLEIICHPIVNTQFRLSVIHITYVAVPKIWLGLQKFWNGLHHVTTPTWRTICHPKANTWHGQPVYKIQSL